MLQIILDYESEEELDQAIAKDPSIVKADHMRYSLINCVVGMLAEINKNAANKKFLFGQGAYTEQGLIEFARLSTETYNIDIEDGATHFTDVTTNFMLIMNSKFGGGHMNLSPISIMNDGLCELGFYKQVVGRKSALKLLDDTKAGGKQMYDENQSIIKFKTFKLTNRVTLKDGTNKK